MSFGEDGGKLAGEHRKEGGALTTEGQHGGSLHTLTVAGPQNRESEGVWDCTTEARKCFLTSTNMPLNGTETLQHYMNYEMDNILRMQRAASLTLMSDIATMSTNSTLSNLRQRLLHLRF